MSKTSAATSLYALLNVRGKAPRKGTTELGQFFRDVRLANKHPKKTTFAEHELKMDSAHLGRIESGKRLPGPEVLEALHDYVLKAGRSPRELLILWLEAQGLMNYANAVRTAIPRPSTRRRAEP